MRTKKLFSFTLDKELLKKFDDLVFNNEKSIRVETLIREFVENNPTKTSLKYSFLHFPPEKRGVQHYDYPESEDNS